MVAISATTGMAEAITKASVDRSARNLGFTSSTPAPTTNRPSKTVIKHVDRAGRLGVARLGTERQARSCG